MKQLRKVWVYRNPQLVGMEELKKGDIFQLQKAGDEDNVDDSILHLALEDAIALDPEKNNGSTASIMAGYCIRNVLSSTKD